MNKCFLRFFSALLLVVFSFQTLMSAEISVENNCLAPKSQVAVNSENDIRETFSPVRVLLNKIKPWAVVFFFVLATQAFGQNSIKTIDPLFQAVKGTVSEQRVDLERSFADQLYTLARDHNRNIMYQNPDNQSVLGNPDFEDYVRQNSAPTTEAVKEMLQAFNYLVHNTLYQPLTLVNGKKSTFYHEVKRVAGEYGVDPYLLYMHAVLERLDRTSIEQYTDKISDKASKGRFQMQGVSLMDHLERIYKLPKDQRIAEYPFTKKYETFEVFRENVDLNEVLDFKNTTSYNPLEIELAASFIKVQLSMVRHYFGSDFSENFTGRALSTRPNLEQKNLLTAWTLFNTSGIGKYSKFQSMEEIFNYCKKEQPYMYTWAKYSWRLYDYIRAIDKINGYEGFNEQNFVNIDGSMIFENTSKNPFTLFFYLIKTVPRTYLALGLIGMMGFLFTAYKIAKLLRKTGKSRQNQKTSGRASSTGHPLYQQYLDHQQVASRKTRSDRYDTSFDQKMSMGDFADRQKIISRAA